MLKLRNFLMTSLAICLGVFVNAQVTTGSISGSVKDQSGKVLEGATVTAVHLPSGTKYNTVSKKGGSFNIPNARIGGPYKLSVEYVGQKKYEAEGFNLILGEIYEVNVVMGEDIKQISDIIITGGVRKSSAEKTGTSTNINQRLLTTIPTISRSLTNFTALTPQSNGTSFAGRDNRYNNIQIDGANLNNNFGLSSDLLPGGSNQPISLDAVEEVSVNVSPFDVWQGGFTGAGVNVATKSGTNTLKGSAYYLFRTEQMNGKKISGTELTNLAKQSNKIFGVTVGGPIIKDKLFFFVSGEMEEEDRPGITFTPKGGSGTGNISSTPIDSLKKLSDHLKSKYNYDPGAYDNFQNFQTKNYKLLGKIDWNFSRIHKVTLRYQEMVGTDDQTVNATSIPNSSGAPISRLPNSRFSLNSMAFANSNYAFENAIRSGALEVNSSNGGKWANQFITTFTRTSTIRNYDGPTTPAVDIFNNSTTNNYISFGTDPFSNNNQVKNDIFTITNNFKYYKGKHTLTFGATYDYQYVGNMFMPGSHGHFLYNSLDDFINDRAPIFYSYLFSVVPGKSSVFSAELRVGQGAAYLQDDIVVNDRLKLTLGLRADIPIYPEQPLENPNITKLSFPDANGKATNYSTGAWPKSTPLWSPRVGFRWDVDGDKSMIIRGGTGVFTGRVPFVWMTNMPSNSYMYQQGSYITDPSILAGIRYSTEPDAQKSFFNTPAGQLPNNASIVMVDRNFKFPQVWRTNLAVDKRLQNGWSVTLEAIITKDINAVRMRNANEKAPTASLTGSDNRPIYTPVGNATRRIYSNIASAIVLENTNKGGGIVLTAQLNKVLSKGFSASASYTYTGAWDVTSNPGAQATSVWNSNPTATTQNAEELAMSGFVVPHRFMAWISYKKEYLKHLATSITIFYEGRNQGNLSYIVNGDLNGDGNFADLMYIPKDQSEMNFLPITGATPFTAQQQKDAFDQFINNSPYLSQRRGQYAERNAALQPWIHTINLNFQQDLFTNIGKRKNTIRLQADILNFTNMLNKDWGHRFINTLSSNNPLRYASTTNGVAAYRWTVVNGQLVTDPFQLNRSLASTWSAQIGIRYIF
jgi:outer membrane receptor protein involved in Fe transport